MDATIVTALVTLGGFIIVNFVAEDFRRFRNGSSIAAALAGELGSYAEPLTTLQAVLPKMIAEIKHGGRSGIPFRPVDFPKDRIFEANLGHLDCFRPILSRILRRLWLRQWISDLLFSGDESARRHERCRTHQPFDRCNGHAGKSREPRHQLGNLAEGPLARNFPRMGIRALLAERLNKACGSVRVEKSRNEEHP